MTYLFRKEFRTRTIPANGLNPMYNEDPFQFRKVKYLIITINCYISGGSKIQDI